MKWLEWIVLTATVLGGFVLFSGIFRDPAGVAKVRRTGEGGDVRK